MKLSVLILLTFLSITTIAQESKLQGVVYLDENANGKLDKEDTRLENIQVSNRCEVTRTNKKGEYELPYNNNDFVFVTKPANYRFASDSLGYGMFYRSLEGWQGEQLNFPLYKNNENRPLRALLVGDPQMADKARLEFFRDGSVTHMMKHQSDFFLVLGDIADNDPEILSMEKELMAQLDIDGYHVAGNHDVNYESKEPTTHFKTFKQVYGPDYYSFNYGCAHFVVLNNINYYGWNTDDNKKGSYFGGIDAKQLDWLKNDLSDVPRDNLIVICTHLPLLKDYIDSVSIAAIHDLLIPFDKILGLSGHLHGVKAYDNDTTTLWLGKGKYEALVVGATSGGWWTAPYTESGLPYATCTDGSPKGYFLLEIKDTDYTYRFIPEHYAEDYQIRICSPEASIDTDQNVKTEVIVNWFVGKKDEHVYLQIDDQEPVKMENYRGTDPFIESTLHQRINLDDWTPGLLETDHLWKANLPSDLSKGFHTIKIKASNKEGQTFTANKIIELK